MTRAELIAVLNYWPEKPWDRHQWSTQDLAAMVAHAENQERERRAELLPNITPIAAKGNE